MGLGTPDCNILIPMNRMRRKFIDIGVNILDEQFQGIYHGKRVHAPDVDIVINRSECDKLILLSGSLDELESTLKFIEEHSSGPELYTTAGIHPTRMSDALQKDDAKTIFQKFSSILDNPLNRSKIIAIGECGLDYDRLSFSGKEDQNHWADIHFQLSRIYHLPFIFHDRNTNGDFLRCLQENPPLYGGVVHSFTGSWEEASNYLTLGLDIGINGCSLKTDENLNVVKQIPLNRMHLETDSPWCSIKRTHASFRFTKDADSNVKKEKYHPEEGSTVLVNGRCEPRNILQVAQVIAGIKQISLDEVIDACSMNSINLFFSHESSHSHETSRSLSNRSDS
jgi:TatD DNase family protein